MFEVTSVANVVAGVAIVALAAWFAYLDFASRLHRAFAAFLLLRGVSNVFEGMATQGALPQDELIADLVLPYFDVGIILACLHFALVFRERYGAPLRPRVAYLARAGGLAAGGVAMVAYALDHGLFYGGPLSLLPKLRLVAYTVCAAALARDALAAGPGPRRAAGLLAAAGFLLTPAFIAGIDVGTLFYRFIAGEPFAGAPTWLALSWPLLGVAVGGLVAVALAPVRRAARADASLRAASERLTAGAIGAAGAGLLFVGVLHRAPFNVFGLLDGVFTLALPLLVAYALLRHRLFDLDVRVKWTISRGTLAAAFVAVGFVVSEGAASLFEGWTGSPYLGIAAAGLLVFAIAPLQRLADRVAEAAMPGVRPVAELGRDDRLGLYREQVRIAWEDGTLTRKDRRLLEAARTRLGISAEEAARVEAEAVAAPPVRAAP